ncbi:MAG: glycosyltransferase family 4 protein [Lachnospiraceae bacterium]|nr:glycosyltransferase family 4 protein [Lachnospiraceae bacterium]
MIGHKRVPSREGGVEVVVWELSQRLKDRGYTVDCYNRSGYHVSAADYDKIPGKRGYYRDGVRILTIPTVRNPKLNAIIYAVLGTLRALFGRYDVIHYHAEGPCLMLWLPKLFGIRTVATIHGLDWQRAKWGNFASRMLLTGEAIAAKRADEVIVLSHHVQEYFYQKYGRKTHYIPNGIQAPTRCPVQEIREKWGLSGGDYILTLSRLVPEKGLHYLLEAFHGIDTDVKLVIAGGSGGAASYVEKLHRMGEKDGRVIFTGFVSGRPLEELMSNAMIFCLPSDVEGMAVSLLEAMSYGNCCLVSDIPENLEVTEDKAESFAHGDVRDLKKKLQELLANKGRRELYRQEAASFIMNKHDWETMTTETEKLYHAGS